MAVHFQKGDSIITVITDRNLNLLGHAQLEEIDLGSQCGGHGICGADRIHILNHENCQLSPPTEMERELLTEDEIQIGIRLACQCWPEIDQQEIKIKLN